MQIEMRNNPMRLYQDSRHSSQLIFTISLFLLYVIMAILVILCGANVHEQVHENSMMNNNIRTSISYIREKIHQGDMHGNISSSHIAYNDNPLDVLSITSTYDLRDYITYIYCHDNQLYELFTSADAAFTPTAGTALTDIKAMTIEEANYMHSSPIMKITITDSLNTNHVLLVHPNSVDGQ